MHLVNRQTVELLKHNLEGSIIHCVEFIYFADALYVITNVLL